MQLAGSSLVHSYKLFPGIVGRKWITYKKTGSARASQHCDACRDFADSDNPVSTRRPAFWQTATVNPRWNTLWAAKARMGVIAAAFTLLLGSAFVQAQSLFQQPEASTILSAGSQPSGVAVADFARTGYASVAVANEASNTLTVYPGNGPGTFGTPMTVSTCTGPTQLISADFNNDSYPDLAVACSTANEVQIFLNNRAGAFQTGTTITTAADPVALVAGDFNSDGYADLAVACGTSGSVTVLLTGGVPIVTSNTAKTINVAGTPSAITAGYFDSTHHLDLAIAGTSGTNGTVEIEIGDGTGNFTQGSGFSVQSNPVGIVAGNWNHTGITDLAVLNGGSGTVSVFSGKGNDTFTSLANVPLVQPSANIGVGSIAAVDVNGDGTLDLIAAGTSTNGVYLLLGNGDGSFQPVQQYSVPNGPASLAVGDFNRDGKPDLAVTEKGGSSVALLINNTLPTPEPGGESSAPLYVETNMNGNMADSITLADFNHSGYPETAIAYLEDDVVRVRLHSYTGAVPAYSVGSQPYDVVSGDLNGDGYADLVTANVGDGTVSVLLNKGAGANGTFAPAVPYAVGHDPFQVAIGDLNGDGIPDLAVTNNGDNTVSILYGVHGGTFTTGPTLATGAQPYGIAIGDFSNNGVNDIAVTCYSTSQLYVFPNSGNGTFGSPNIYATDTNPAGLVVGDFNRDGKLDIVTGNTIANDISFFAGNGDGSFQPGVIGPSLNFPVSIAAGDVNGDGILDIVGVASNFGDVVITLGKGDGTFQPRVEVASGKQPWAVALGDMKGRGKLDIATANTYNPVDLATVTDQQRYETEYPPVSGGKPNGNLLLNNSGAQITLSHSPNQSTPIADNVPVTLTAQFSTTYTGPTPTGTVIFEDNNGIVLGTAPSSLSSGTATLTLPNLGSGPHIFTALYSGDANYQPYTSATDSGYLLTVGGSTVNLTLQSYVITVGGSLTYTATLGAAGDGADPTGTVTLYGILPSGATQALDSPQTLVGNGNGTSSVSNTVTPGLAAGNYELYAVYSPRTGSAFAGGSSYNKPLFVAEFAASSGSGAYQQPTDLGLDTGIQPYETYDRAQENVNIASGNLNITIPLVHVPGRDGHDLNVSLTYNSQNWTPVANLDQPNSGNNDDIDIGWQYASSTAGVGSTGWQYNVPILYATGVNDAPSNASPLSEGQPHTTNMCWSNFVLVMGDGRKYSFGGPKWSSSSQVGAAMDCQEDQTWSCSNDGQCDTLNNVPYPYMDQLIAYDWGSEQGGGLGQGVMLDLTNVANGTGNAVVRFRDGTQILFPFTSTMPTAGGGTPSGPLSVVASSVVDPNGNVISPGLGAIIDTLGRTVILGAGGGPGGPGQMQYKDSSGTLRTITLNFSSFRSAPMPTWTSPAANTGSVHGVNSGELFDMLSSIVLPDGLSYTFQYNQYGEIIAITYPSGGYTKYTYQAFPHNEYEWTTSTVGSADSREVVEKAECPAAVVPAGATTPSGYVGSSAVGLSCSVPENITTYQRQPTPNISPVTVIDPLLNQTAYTFGELPAYVPSNPPPGLVNADLSGPYVETNRAVSQGSSTVIETVATKWQGSLPKSKTTTLYPSGLQSEVDWNYDTAVNLYTMSFYDQEQTFPYYMEAETDNLISEKDYTFGSGSPGALLKQTITGYLSQGFSVNPVNSVNYEKYPTYILNRKQSETTEDGSGNQFAQTTYEYDNYQGGIVSSGATQHGITYSPSYTTRGNVTAVNRWLNTTGTMLTTRNYQFDDAGNVLIQTDPEGHQTQFGYANAWANSSCNPTSGNADAYVKSIKNALGQSTTYTWNSCTGTMASTTDPNLQLTTFGYDLMDRRVVANYPDQGQTCLQYSDAQNSNCPQLSGAALPIQIVTTKKMSSTQFETSTTILDGLSRVQQTQLTSDPTGTDYVDTTYDPVGNVASVSNPYRTVGGLTYVTGYAYDALNRKTLQTNPDQSTETWNYDNGNCVKFTDEDLNSWVRCYDSLGDLTSVVEPAGGTSPTYTYNPLSDLTGVTQGAESRSFTYDSLSRLVCASNPESSQNACPASATGTLPSGTVQYTYDNDGNVHTKTDARGTTITYSYEPLNRVTGKTYTDGTMSAAFGYDGKDASGNPISGALNPIGRLTGSSNAEIASTYPIYDPMGRLRQKTSCISGTSGGCFYSSTVSATYDGVGDVITLTNGSSTQPIQFTYGYDNAGRLSAITSNWTPDGNHPGTLFQANSVDPPSYGPAGLLYAEYGLSASQPATVTLTQAYDNRMRLFFSAAQGKVGSGSTAGSATLAITGSEQSKGTATPASGSVTVNGSEQSKQTTNNTGGTSSTGVILISGNEQSGYPCQTNCPLIYDSGTIYVDLNGQLLAETQYGEFSTPAILASGLAANINGTSSSLVTAVASPGGEVYLTSKATGTVANYPNLTVTVVDTSNDPSLFSSPSFGGSTSGSMTGGQDQVLYDAGTIALAVNGHSDSTGFGQGSTTGAIATALAAAVNGDSAAPVTATASGATISLDTKQSGSTVNFSLAANDTYDSTDFSQSSFTVSPSGSSLTGGSNSNGTDIYDAGTVDLTIDGTTESASFGQGSTASSIASSLAAAFAGSSDVNVQASGANLTVTAYGTGSGDDYSYSFTSSYDSGDFSSTSFSGSPASGSLAGGSDAPPLLYSYTVGFDKASNVNAMNDSLMGNWTFTYDRLNRLAGSTGSQSGNPYTNYCWSYDSFGNRKNEEGSTEAFQSPSGGASPCQPQTGAGLTNTWASYNANNQISETALMPNGDLYDPAGDVTNDGANKYMYDGEGRQCAVQSLTSGGMIEYIYDAEGQRVMKGTISTFNCNPPGNGFSVTNLYTRGLNGEDLTESAESSGSYQWDHTNVFANGELLATYRGTETYFALNDWLGTKRAEATPDGKLATYSSLPWGSELTASGTIPDATAEHFTGKERDSESGNDYFGARYFGSSMGRFLSPDPLGGSLVNPQSLNRYAYAFNNPLRFTDPTGMYVTNCASGDKACAKNASSFEKSRQHDLKSKNAGIRAAAGAYGDPGQKNGVTVGFGDPGKGRNGTTTVTGLQKNADGSYSAEATVTIRPGQSGSELNSTVGHEGQHVEDAQGFASTVTPQGYYDLSKNLTQLQTETNAYGITNAILSDEGVTANFGTCNGGPCALGFGVTNPDATIKQLLANPANGYGVTPANPGQRQFGDMPPNPVPQAPAPQ